ncbi:MAG TPA: sugar ABC transporter ATP-binding protein [bacterium]|nr:sugar ABC transporter ATP-binding protein [bacterium]
MRGIDKTFPGVKALDGVDFTLRAGEVQALMGENGAGKSTLIKVLTGVYRYDSGEMKLGGNRIEPRTPPEAQKLGISAVHQEVNLIPHLSVAENMYLGRLPMKFGRIDWKKTNSLSEAAAERMELDIDVSQPLGGYPIAVQQLVAIARALTIDSQVLVLDEPTSSLDEREVEKLFSIVRKLRADGMGIVFVTHFLDQAYEISDRFTILRNGKLVGEYDTAGLPRLELVSKMIGRDATDIESSSRRLRPVAGPDVRPVLEGKGISRKTLKGVDLGVRPGEVLGFAGLLGSGRTETANLVFGIDRLEKGTIEVEGKTVNFKSPRDAIRTGMGLCPEDRRNSGIIPDLSIRENIILAMQASRGWFRTISKRKQAEIADRFIKSLNIITSDMEKPVSQLSGGNQQKVILARWLASEPKLLILDEPTRGVDVGAKAEIEKHIESMCADGVAVILISSELEEVVRGSHRVIVMRDGMKKGELEGEGISLSAIMHLIAGGERETT